jgi:hypothetical protein
VTYQNKPVAVGRIFFDPDTSKGNDGPGGMAGIVNGKYQTEPKFGMVGGHHLVRIAVAENVEDGPIANFVLNVDLPKESGKYDFVLPPPK